MQFVCESPPYTWFRIETEGEASLESRAMQHAVDRYFKQAYQRAARAYAPPASVPFIEQNIGLKAHIQRVMPLFLTLRDGEGTALATAMLPPKGQHDPAFKPIIVGFENSNPFVPYAAAIRKLGEHYGIKLDPDRCYPYRRS